MSLEECPLSSPVPAGHTREVGAEAIHDWPIEEVMPNGYPDDH